MKPDIKIISFLTVGILPVLLIFSSAAYAVTETFSTAGTFNWTCPAGVSSIQVECWGGGGAGGLATGVGTGSSQNSGGGGGGAYARKVSIPVTPLQSYTITIPAAAVSGSGGNTANGASVSGSAVSFVGNSGVTVTAAGGDGGKNIVVTSNLTAQGNGGAGGTTAASVGDVGGVFAGGSGANGTLGALRSQDNSSGAGGGGAGNAAAGGGAVAGTGSGSTPGAGGIAGGGNGGTGAINANTTAVAGGTGTTPGGGGGGGKNVGNRTTLGGTGGLGQIVLTYSYPSYKANNSIDLNLASSWTAGVPSGIIGEWGATVTGPNTTSLGGDLTFSGIRILNPGGLVIVNTGNTLTLGTAPVDIDLSAATQDLILNCDLAMSATNVWDVASGRAATLGGVVSGSSSVTKLGSGTVILSGSNTYSGATTISAGSLLVNSPGSLAPGSSVAVIGGTLGGSGTIGGSVTVAAAGSLAPGASAGTLAIGGNLDISALAGGAGKLLFEIGTLATSDKIAVAGTLAIGSGVLGSNDFFFTDLGGLQTGTYTLVATTGGIIGTLDPNNLSGMIGSLIGYLQINGNDLEFVSTGFDTDYDGMPDSFELANTNPPSATALNPGDDLENGGVGDGLTNLQEYQLGTNPTLKDTDGDGFDDFFEFNTGSDPTLDTSRPAAITTIRAALEFRFNAANGVSYRIESSTDSTIWNSVETNIIGEGAVVARFYSTENQPKRHYRVRRN